MSKDNPILSHMSASIVLASMASGFGFRKDFSDIERHAVYDIMGGDIEIGADAPLGKPGAGGKPQYSDAKYTRQTYIPLGFDSGAVLIGAGAGAQPANSPQLPFKPMRIIVPTSLADAFVISNIVLGVDSQIAGVGNMPAAAFVPATEGIILEFPTVQPQQQITMSVTNISNAAMRFLAVFFGKALRQ